MDDALLSHWLPINFLICWIRFTSRQNFGLDHFMNIIEGTWLFFVFYYSQIGRFEYIGRKQSSHEWRKRLPELAKRLEEILHRKFPNKVLLSFPFPFAALVYNWSSTFLGTKTKLSVSMFHHSGCLILYCLSRMTTTIWWRGHLSRNCSLLSGHWALRTNKINRTYKRLGRQHLHPAQWLR